MIEKSIAFYTIIDDLLKKNGYNEPKNRKTSDAEIITTCLISALYFSGNHEKGICFFKSTKLMGNMLSKSRFNRRLHLIRNLIVDLFFQLAWMIKKLNINAEYIIDTMRKRVETIFNEISGLFSKKIHAVTDHGFVLKIILSLFSYTSNKIEF